MRIAHFSDQHLGHRRYAAMTPEGRNRREQDVSDAFSAAIDGILAVRPDLVLSSGDQFDIPRPSNNADADAVRGFRKLLEAGIPVVIIEGTSGHEVAVDAGSPLAILAHTGCKVVCRAQRVSIQSLNTHILCVPERDLMRVKLEPSTAKGTQLLLAHGKFSSSLYRLPDAECRAPSDIHPDFQYAGLGDWHIPTQVAANAFYAGAIEAVSSNPWGEIGTRYGWNEFDTETGVLTRHAIPTRAHIDLPPISAHGLIAKEITQQVLGNLAAVDLAGAVVRQVVTDMPRGIARSMDLRALRSATKAALHFQLDERRPVVHQVGRALVPGADLVEDDTIEWLDELNREDKPQPDVPDPARDAFMAQLDAACDRDDNAEVQRLLASRYGAGITRNRRTSTMETAA